MTIRRTEFELYNKDGDPIRGDVWSGGDAKGKAAIVICHGFKGFKNWGFFPYTAEQLVEGAGYPVVQFNLSGCGVGPDLENFTELDKFERNTFSRELDDLKAVLDAAQAGELPRLQPRERFGLLGHSRGGLSVIVTAAEDPRVKAIVTWNAVSHIDRWTEEQKAEWRAKGRIEILNTRTGEMMPLGVGLLEDAERNAARLDIQRAAARLEVPFLIIHGADDDSVSIADGEQLAAVAPAETTRLERIERAGHTFGAVHPFEGSTEQLDRAVDLSAGWFAVYLGE
jgi:pimeloyl-ACP methyl ester carboxylesterase